MRDTTKKKILNVSMRLFADQGLDRTKVEDIVQEARISRATFYNYFHSKEEIFFCLIETEMDRIMTSSERAAQEETDPYRKMRTYILKMIVGAREMIRELNVRHDEAEVLPPVPKKLVESMIKRSVGAVGKILDYGVQAGALTVPNTELTAHLILSALDVFINPFKFGEIEKESVEKRVDELMAILCFGLSRRTASVSGRADKKGEMIRTG
jgi:AcrR family transcriptional regulator